MVASAETLSLRCRVALFDAAGNIAAAAEVAWPELTAEEEVIPEEVPEEEISGEAAEQQDEPAEAAPEEGPAEEPVVGETVDVEAADDGEPDPVSYTDASGTDATCADYTVVVSTDAAVTWTSGWYVLVQNANISERITVSGDVKLILCDRATLTAAAGIEVSNGNTLTIYGQTSSGILTATGGTYAVGIGGSDLTSAGTFTIYGGTVQATGGKCAAGIGGGNGGDGGTISIRGGTVIASGDGDWGQGAGIGGGDGGDSGAVTISGGTVRATGGSGAAGIGGGSGGRGTVTISGGTVTATAGLSAAGIGGGYGGGDTAAGSEPNIVTITGGKVTASRSGSEGSAIGDGHRINGTAVITIGRTNASDFIKADSWNGTVTLQDAFLLDGTDVLQPGPLSDPSVLAGRKLTSPNVHEHLPLDHVDGIEASCTQAGAIEYWVCGQCEKYFADEYGLEEITSDDIPMLPHDLVHHEAQEPDCARPGMAEYWQCTVCGRYFTSEDGADENRVDLEDLAVDPTGVHTMIPHEYVAPTFTADGSIAYWECSVCGGLFSDEAGTTEITLADTVLPMLQSLTYLDASGSEQTCDDYRLAAPSETDWTGGWYAVRETITVSSRISVSGTVHLILCDGATLTASAGIAVNVGNSLTIYAQSTGGSAGAINAAGISDCAGIGGEISKSCGTVIINGGRITAVGGDRASGIGGGPSTYNAITSGGRITINGGNASGQNCGTITINGGIVTATTSGSGAAIGNSMGANGGSVTINGGVVKATGTGEYSTGIGDGYASRGCVINLNWTGASDSITASSYKGNVTARSPFLADGTDPIPAGRIHDFSLISGRTLTPYAHEHTCEHIDPTIPTYDPDTDTYTNGNLECWHCTLCGTYYTDEACTSPVSQQDMLVPYFVIDKDNPYVRILKYNGTDAVVHIADTVPDNYPDETLRGLAINCIGDSAFKNNTFITKVITSDSLRKVSTEAFRNCTALVEFVAGSGLITLESSAFANTPSLTSFTCTTVTGRYVLTAYVFGNQTMPTFYGMHSGDFRSMLTEKRFYLTSASGDVVFYGIDAHNAPTWTWAEDHSSASAAFDCGKVCAYRETLEAVITSELTDDGRMAYTATATDENGYEYTDTVYVLPYTVTVEETENGTVAADRETAFAGDSVTLTVTPDPGFALESITVTDSIHHEDVAVDNNRFTMPDGDVSVTAVFTALPAISYLDENGEGQTREVYIPVTADGTAWAGGWYAVTENVTVSGRIGVSGEVYLILCDGATLTASAGIAVNAGDSLTVYAQSTNSDAGAIKATGSSCNAGIGGNNGKSGGTITVNGGRITATGGQWAAGIGGGAGNSTLTIDGGTITINGGSVLATSGTDGAADIGGGNNGSGGIITINGGTVEAKLNASSGAAIGSGSGPDRNCGTITINGGTVKATGGGAGIGNGYNAKGGTIRINGGVVTATGGSSSSGIGNGSNGSGCKVYLSWTDETDSITVNKYAAR